MALFTSSSVDALPAIEGGTPVRSHSSTLIFGSPVIGDEEIAAVTDCLRSRWIGLGPKVAEFEKAFAAYKGAPFAVALNSGTAAIHLALLGLGIGPGDEVIAPTMTFCSTIHSIVHVGATPVLIDCDDATFNIDPALIEERITPRTRAILVVHMGGRCCDMEPILDIARRHDLRIVEDCAHAIESSYRDTPAGLIGDAGCFSFYATKNVTTGDGGMVITRHEQIARRVRRLSLHGMDADAWSRIASGADYLVHEAGFKYNMTDMEAALGLVQLRHVDRRWLQRQAVWNVYRTQLKDLPLQLPPDPEPCTRHAYHLYTVQIDPTCLKVGRDEIRAALRAENIGSGIHYRPVHLQPYYRDMPGCQADQFPAAARVGRNSFSLPLAADLTEADVADVCEAVRRVLNHYTIPARRKGADWTD